MNFVKTLLLCLTVATLFAFSFSKKEKRKLQLIPTEKTGFYTTSYGIQKNNTIFIKNAIKPNEFLSSVLTKYSIPSSKAYEVSTFNDSILDPKKIKTGNSYAIILDNNNGNYLPQKFIYEKNVIDYVVFDFSKDEIEGLVKRKPIIRKKVISSAIIKGSLYQTMIDIGANPLLAVELSDIYKWTIDFYKIQENDFFKAIYYEEFVEGKSIGEFEIEASVFNHRGLESKAFTYKRASEAKPEYFDEEGNTLKAFFLQAPVAYSRISSPFSMNRFHPVTKKNKPHLGTDYAAPTGTPIYSTANGVITKAQYSKYNGNYVKVKHNDTYTTQYLHMSKIANGIKPGVAVEQGQVIGYVGSTGLATGPHVCYRFWKNGKQVNPSNEVTPKANPLSEEELPTYLESIKLINKKLDKISLRQV